jgi:hypothetical protein
MEIFLDIGVCESVIIMSMDGGHTLGWFCRCFIILLSAVDYVLFCYENGVCVNIPSPPEIHSEVVVSMTPFFVVDVPH